MRMKTKAKGFFQWFLIFIIGLSTQLFLLPYEKEIKTISQELAQKIGEAGKKTVAIVDFNDLQGNVMELGRFLSEELSVAISSSGKGFEVVDRVHLKAILKEHKLSFTGLINKESAQKLGQIAGVDALITGTITPFGDSVRITVKILDINTAKLIGAVTANIPKTKAIEELLERGIGDGIQMDTDDTNNSTPKLSGKTFEADGFIFKPGVCRASGDKIVCTFSIMNNGNEDREIEISSHISSSFLVDNFGNKYPIGLNIGGKGSGIGWDSLKEIFPPKLFINVSIIARDVKPGATHYTAIIGINGFRNLVLIRNIPVVK
jgi:TolB-like protein